MKKLVLLFLLSAFAASAQLNPASNLQYGAAYNYPGYSGCPQYNCFKLTWSPPTASNDTLIGYRVYRNNILYWTQTDTLLGCAVLNVCDAASTHWFDIMPFWCTVKAMYNSDSAMAASIDSVYIPGAMINISEAPASKKLSIYPNPSAGKVTITYASGISGDETVTVFNALGKQVKQIKVTGNTTALPCENLPEGLYFIQLTRGDKVIATDKLILNGR